MTEKRKNPLKLRRVFKESWQTFLMYLGMIFILPLLFTPIGIAIEKAMEVIPPHGIHYMVAIILNFMYMALLLLVHFAYLYTLIKNGSWRMAFHALMLDDVDTLRKFLNFFIVNFKLILVLLLPTVLILKSYENLELNKGISLVMFLLASLLYAAISAKFAFGLVIQVYGAGTKKERSLRLISAFSHPCYMKLVLLEWLITVIVYIPKWAIAFYKPDQVIWNYIFDNYLIFIINFVVSIWIVKAYDQVYRKTV